MTDLTPAAVEGRLDRLLTSLEEATEKASERIVDAAIAEAEFRIAWASAINSAKGRTVAEKEADATLRCEKELRERKNAEARSEAAKLAVFSLRSQIEGVRTLIASSREMAR